MALSPFEINEIRKEVQGEFARSLKRRTRRLTAGFAALAIGLGFAVYDSHQQFDESLHAIVHSGRAVSVGACNGRYLDREYFRGLFTRLRDNAELSYKNRVIPKEQYMQSKVFYDQQLRNLREIDCRVAERITSDPASTEIKVPRPYYPGAPNVPKVVAKLRP